MYFNNIKTEKIQQSKTHTQSKFLVMIQFFYNTPCCSKRLAMFVGVVNTTACVLLIMESHNSHKSYFIIPWTVESLVRKLDLVEWSCDTLSFVAPAFNNKVSQLGPK